MNLADELADLKPRTKKLVFDLVEEAGFDVTDWRASATNPAKAKANPKYCYEWSFVESGKVVIFNLWHDIMKVLDGEIVYQENFRANAAFHRANGGKSQWSTRGDKLDAAVDIAARNKLPIRVIILDGDRRNTEDPNSESSRVSFRELDPSEWYVREYNPSDGAFILARGRGRTTFADQFDTADQQIVDRKIDKFNYLHTKSRSASPSSNTCEWTMRILR